MYMNIQNHNFGQHARVDWIIYIPWMRWCKAVYPCESWTLISQPVWRRFILNWETNWLLSTSCTREHVEHRDKTELGNWASSSWVVPLIFLFAKACTSEVGNLREKPPSRQNSNNGLAEVKPVKEKHRKLFFCMFQTESL